MTTNSNELITTAEKEITKILEKLEIDTGMVIDRLTIDDITGSQIGDERPRLYRRLMIGMMRLPGTKWK